MVTGRLKNGLRYAILRRQTEEPGVGLLMRNEGGFIAERRPGERGLAHLIEHEALVSPTSGSPDDLRHFIRIGIPLTFPAPSAGTTSWRETNYFLSTRTTSSADLDTLLGLFREAATDLTFRPDAVDDQRADVMREMATRKPGNDVYASYVAAVAPGSPTDVIDAQNSDDVPTASIETIRSLYRRLYRPKNMMIVIVGNVDAGQMKALIEKRFGDWQGAAPDAVPVPYPTFRSDRIKPISVSALPAGRRTAMMTVVMPTPPPAHSRRQQARAMLMDMLAVEVVNDRMARTHPDSPPGEVGIFIDNGEQGDRLIMLWDNFAADQWREAVAGLNRTTCDLRTVGFSEQEWSTAEQGVIHSLEQKVATSGKEPNVELAKDLSHTLADGRDVILPDELLGDARIFLPTVTARAGNAWFLRQWPAQTQHIRVEAPELRDVDDPISAIRAAADEGAKAAACMVRR